MSYAIFDTNWTIKSRILEMRKLAWPLGNSLKDIEIFNYYFSFEA